MKNKKVIQNLWVRLTVVFMLANVFMPSFTVLADELGSNQGAIEQIDASKDKSPVKEETVTDTASDNTSETESAVDQNKNTETAIGESQNSNDSPILPIETPTFEVQEPSAKMITFNENGTPFLDGETFYKTEEQITNEDLQALMIQGDAKGGYARTEKAGVTIEYLGQITYGDNVVGHFRVNGEDAFCIEHAKPTPPSGTPATEAPYEIENIKSALYYGWNGAENIFTDFAEGYTATSLVLSYFYTGVASGINTPEAEALLSKVATNSVPDPSASFSTVNPVVSVVNGEQRSENITLKGDSRNIFKLNIPAGMTYHLVGGSTLTNGTVEVKGGDTFYLTADMKYTNNYATGALQGSMKKWQSILTKPIDGNLQTVARGGWIDPQSTISFAAKFFARTGNAEFLKVSSETNAPIAGVKYAVTMNGEVTEATTDSNGQFKIKDIVHGTVVKVKETNNPEGYILDTKEYSVTIVAGETQKLTLKNDVQKGKIKGLKQIEVFNPEATEEQNNPVYDTLPGANITFDVVAKTDITLPDKTTVKNKAGDIVDTVTTNSNGEFASNVELWIGSQNEYQLVERDVPANYRQPSDVQTTFSIPYGKNTEKLITFDLGSIDNLLKTGEWDFNKLNEITQTGLEGAVFLVEGISAHNQDVSYVFTSSELGNVFKLPAGNYKVTEIRFPDGFGQSNGESEVKIITIKDGETTTTNWNNAPIVEKEKTPEMGTQAFAENGGKDFDTEVDNKLYDKISNKNYDNDTKFFVTKVIGETTGTIYYEAKEEKTLDENGIVVIETIIPAGTIQKENVYFYEEAYNSEESFENGEEPYTEHDGKNDYGQTLFYKEKPVVPTTPETPVVPSIPTPTPVPTKVVKTVAPRQIVKAVLPQTGEDVSSFALIGLLIIGLVAVGFAVRNNRMKKEKNKLMEKVELYGFGGEQSIFSETEDQVECEVATLLVEGIIETGSKVGLENEKAIRLLEKVEIAYLTSTIENSGIQPVEQL